MKTNNKLAKFVSYVAVAVVALGAGSALAAGPKTKTKKELTGVVNVNTATAAQLDLLPGIGQKAAKRIIEQRASKPFAKLEDLRRVKGLGVKKVEKLRAHVIFQGTTTASLKKVVVDGQQPTAPPSAQGRRASQR